MEVWKPFVSHEWKQFASNVGINSVSWSLMIVMLLVLAYWYLTIPSGIPPGPVGLPLVGYLPFLGDRPHLKFMQLGKKYGSVFSFYLGSRLVIVLNDYNAVREAFITQADNFAGRPIGFNLNFFTSLKNTKSMSMSDGSYWRDHRRFMINHLTDCGMGKSSLEPHIVDEIQRFIAVIKSYDGRPTNFADLVSMSILNIIAIMAFGKRFEYDDPWLQSHKTIAKAFLEKNSVNFWLAFPWLSYIPLTERYASRHLRSFLKEIQVITQMIMDDRNRTTSYVNAFLKEKQKRQMDEESFGNDSLVQNIRTLITAGTDSVSTTLLWAITYMMLHPEVQEKAHREVDEIIGADRVPAFSDRLRTPYLHATICEIQRIRTLVPFSIPHRNREETTIFGYRIPKSTYILANLYATQMDSEYWSDPDEFRPERFLDENGCVHKPDQFVVFSLGKRRCLGEPLAHMELYLYMATMLQHFTFKLPPNHKLDTDGQLGQILKPKNVVTCAVPRK